MKKSIMILALILGFSTGMDAQSKITDDKIEQKGSSVVVTFEVTTEENSIPRNRKEVIIPYLYNGKDTLFLDPLEVYGHNRFKRERQEFHIAGHKEWDLGHNQIMKGDVFQYEAETSLKRWMKPAQLGIKRQMVGCACENEMADEEYGQFTFVEPQLPPRRIIQPVTAEATREWGFGGDEMEVIFKVSKTQIDPTVFDNEATFGKILAAIDKIYSNPEFKLEKIQVAGYASPEGRPGFNKWLGENRAKALINYIIAQRPEYGLTEANFEMVNGDENWAGLRRLLEGSEIDQKDEVIAIIDNKDLSGEMKKARIKAMDKGKVWNKMLKEIYPHLRSARYLSVYYDSANDKAIEVINGANEMISEGQGKEAYERLMTIKHDVRSNNSIGAALVLEGRYEEAITWFEKAMEVNPEQAKANMDAIGAELDYEQQQKDALEEYLKSLE